MPSILDTLFGDLPLDHWTGDPTAPPWSSFAAARDALARNDAPAARAKLESVLGTPGLESRHYAQAWHILRKLGVKPPAAEEKRVFGVVLEVSLDQGLDVLAAYEDRTARYFNFSGAGIVWDRPNPSLDAHVDAVLAAARVIAPRIGPWTQPRRPPPPKGHVRLNMLTPAGLCLGEGPLAVLAKDPMGGPLVSAGTRLMQRLVEQKKR
jgi:hypothetical protein